MKPCNECGNVYQDCMYEDAPLECKLNLPMKADCASFIRYDSFESRVQNRSSRFESSVWFLVKPNGTRQLFFKNTHTEDMIKLAAECSGTVEKEIWISGGKQATINMTEIWNKHDSK